ncbi:AT-hook motif nuclear-localized protein 1-like [Macadamia integrifolia]|uniref:AT-hook motif nuclear-localized protein 1-like n=1 Tax=Macadamia integrifolia TaxID=60698 RepID=UPI001C4EBDFD|nr:AT-hook motif nuclear-localized protein 1-like [Macadamia integrifolia]XP_042502383.1 AT-hook motif nuclear-localized protein 1-like [Macadamia integrifolia]
MEGREGMSTGVAVMGADAHPNFHVAARTENPNSVAAATVAAAPPAAPPAAATPVGTSQVSVALPGATVKKKRGRPRKYGPDGAVSLALSPMPISSSAPAPPTGDFSGNNKRGRGRPNFFKQQQQQRMEVENMGEWVSCSVGANFTPHVITVATGEDVTMKIISFSQQGPRAICILSANGAISNVTLRQPDSSGGTLTYEGRFEILSLSGSFMPSESGGTRSRSGGMSVSLASPDGRVLGGGVAGLLVAASPIQVVVGSFLPSTQQELKPKKQKTDHASAGTPNSTIPISSAEMEESYGGQGQRNATPKSDVATGSSFRGDNWAPMHSMQDSRNSNTDINISLPSG